MAYYYINRLRKCLLLIYYDILNKSVRIGLLRVGELLDVRLHVVVDDGRAGHCFQGDPHFGWVKKSESKIFL